MAGDAQRLVALAEQLLGNPLPVRVRAWDHSEAGPPGAPVLVVRSRRALRRVLWRPGELGLARAWVAGELDVEGDLYQALDLLAGLLWERDEGPAAPSRHRRVGPARARALARPDSAAAARELLALAGPGLPPAAARARRSGAAPGCATPCAATARPSATTTTSATTSTSWCSAPRMVYSCAYWAERRTAHRRLEDAQRDKLDLICRKLGLRDGQRLLDVGCGWGSLVLHAAREYGVRAVGITLSSEQAAYARKRIAEEGLADRVEIRVQDYREVDDGPYDAISSVGMAEHVGAGALRASTPTSCTRLLKPGGRLLNHQIARRPEPTKRRTRSTTFIDAYVFPDGELAPLGRPSASWRRPGFEVRDVESLREHYALTLRRWVANLEADWARGGAADHPGRARVWRLYMAASALAFEHNRIGVNQVLAVRTPRGGASGLPLRTRDWRG